MGEVPLARRGRAHRLAPALRGAVLSPRPSVGPFVRSLAFLAFAAGGGAVLFPWLLLRGAPREPTAPPLGYALIAAGAALVLWSFFGFAFVGRGTPAPWDAPRRLVIWGPYRWVRNPIYLGVIAVLVGESLAFSLALLAYAAVVAAVFVLFVRLYEEPTLSRRFGREYEEYRRAVPAWLPRPPATDAPRAPSR